MSAKSKYHKTLLACYLGYITQAISANFAPLLFVTFHRSYGIPLGRLAVISSLFFFVQLLVDLASTAFVDRLGYRVCTVAAEVCSAVGLIGLAVLPEVMPDPFAGILIAVVIYAVGSGLLEVLVSPIVEACPFENKESAMSLLHSFYCWGCVGVILGSTAFFALFGVGRWRILACLWALIPIYNVYNFATCPIERLVEEGKGMSMLQLFRTPLFWLLALLMICSGASELSMSQWASAFTESALGVSKTVGDLAGPCLFAVLMGLSRLFYGKYGERYDLKKFMLASGGLCVGCYLLAALSGLPALGLMGCALCGLSVGIMWPGTFSIATKALPLGGTAMFALLALAGDLGGTLGPTVVGAVSAASSDSLRAGLLAGVVFPAVLIVGLVLLRRNNSAKE